jgi:hypothetical protein
MRGCNGNIVTKQVTRWTAFSSLLILSVATAAFPALASTVIVVKTKSGIVVAADSLVSRDGIATGHACKLTVTQNCVFAASGSWYPERGLDVFGIAKQACEATGDLKTRAETYIDLVLPRLTKYLEWDRTTNPEHYRHLVEIGASEVVFVDPHSFEVIRLWFPVDASGKPYSKVLSDDDRPLQGSDFSLVPMGATAEVIKAIKQDPKWAETLEDSMVTFLTIETKSVHTVATRADTRKNSLFRQERKKTLNSIAWWRAWTRPSGPSLLSLTLPTLVTPFCCFTGPYYPGEVDQCCMRKNGLSPPFDHHDRGASCSPIGRLKKAYWIAVASMISSESCFVRGNLTARAEESHEQ